MKLVLGNVKIIVQKQEPVNMLCAEAAPFEQWRCPRL